MKSKILYAVLIIFFASLLIFIRLDRVYTDTIVEAYEIIPTSDGGGFTLMTVEKNVSLGEDSAAVVLSLKPGQEYSGSFLVKNHKDIASEFSFTVVEDFQIVPVVDGEKNRDDAIFLSLNPEKFLLESREWKLINYVLTVPEGFEYGEYEGILSVRDDEVYKTNDGMNLAIAIGVELKVNVTDEVQDYEYVRFMEDIDIEDIAYDATLLELTKIFGLFFVFLTIFFLYKAVMIDKGKIKA